MSYVWIICINEAKEGTEPYKNMSFKTKTKAKVGKYIRNHIDKFLSLFRRISEYEHGFDNGLQEKIGEINNDDEDEVLIEKIKEILEEFTDEEIINEITNCYSGSYESIMIIKIPTKKMIEL